MGMFSRSSYHCKDPGCCGNRVEEKIVEKLVYPPNQPDPRNFRIINRFSANSVVHLLEVVYPNATNYEGRKIILYKDVWLKTILNSKELDPHFLNTPGVLAPFARFKPDVEGWAIGKAVAIALATNTED